jgi:hypothetical protein
MCHKFRGGRADSKARELDVKLGEKKKKKEKNKGLFNGGIALTVIAVLYLVGLVVFVMFRKNVF